MLFAATTIGPHWGDYLGLVLLALVVLLLIGLVLNLNKLLSRASSIRRLMKDTADTGVGAQLVETVAQLQSMAASLDRVAAKIDDVDVKLSEVVQRGPGGEGAAIEMAVSALREGLSELREPLSSIRDAVQRSKIERLQDEVRRVFLSEGYDQVLITTDLTTLDGTDGKVSVEVQREGVKAKGYVILKDGTVVERKLSAPYEMFP